MLAIQGRLESSNEAWFDLIFLVFTITLDQSSAMQLEAFTTVHLTFATQLGNLARQTSEPGH